MKSSITIDQLEQFRKDFEANKAYGVAMRAVVSAGVNKAAVNHESFRKDRHEYSIQLKDGEITNQKQSGRCWMFAALNTMRFQVMKNLNLETFELSQSYPLFYDKLEKSNYFLESILETLDEPTDGRLIAYLLSAPLNDGGQWDMFCSLVEKIRRSAQGGHAGVRFFVRDQGDDGMDDYEVAGICLHASKGLSEGRPHGGAARAKGRDDEHDLSGCSAFV